MALEGALLGQPENLRYLNRVADKFGLRQYMQFNCQVDSARYDEAENLWHVSVSTGASSPAAS